MQRVYNYGNGLKSHWVDAETRQVLNSDSRRRID